MPCTSKPCHRRFSHDLWLARQHSRHGKGLYRLSRVANAALMLTVCVSLGQFKAVFAHGDEQHVQDDGTADPLPSKVLAPGYEYLEHSAPEPGSYRLATIRPAGDGMVLDTDGSEHSLHDLLSGQISVLSFIYRACDDVNGCPLATYVMSQIRDRLSADPDIVEHVQLLSMSFDPLYDTPESMADYAASFGAGDLRWKFLTASSERALDPILDAYGQHVSRSTLATGETTINHVLRVYVIDQKLRVRNIYNSALLHADSLISDLYTLTLEQHEPADESVPAAMGKNSGMEVGPLADDRSGYATGEYVSRSRAIESEGVALDLLVHARTEVPGLPDVPELERLTRDKIALGRQLFFDRRLSINNTFSCAMCHVPEQAFTVNELSTSVGVEGRTVKRNAPSLLNVGFLSRLFHDGREFSLENQVWSPLLAHNEMANPSVGYVIRKIESDESYHQAFESAFRGRGVTIETIGEALASYQRTLVAGNAPFDHWFYTGNDSAVTDDVKAGYELFTGKARCSQCHSIGDSSALFTDQKMHNTGIGYRRSMKKHTEPHPVTLAPGVVIEIDPAVYADAAETPPNDLGLYEVTQDPGDRWKFRTPPLRNVALTSPYMHDGSLETLEDVIAFYVAGGVANPTLSPMIAPVELDGTEQAQLVSFLNALTSEDFPKLRSDALEAPVGDL